MVSPAGTGGPQPCLLHILAAQVNAAPEDLTGNKKARNPKREASFSDFAGHPRTKCWLRGGTGGLI